MEVKMEHDLLGSILSLALQRKIDMGKTLWHHFLMQKAPKSRLLKKLETQVIFETTSNFETFVIDGLFFPQLLKNYQKRLA